MEHNISEANKILEESMNSFMEGFDESSNNYDENIAKEEKDIHQSNRNEQIKTTPKNAISPNAFDIINDKIEDANFVEIAANITNSNEIDNKNENTAASDAGNDNSKNENVYKSTLFGDTDYYFGSDTTPTAEAVQITNNVIPEDEVEHYDPDILYTTFSLAKELDVTPQTIRNYADYFEEFLSNERGGKGQKVFNSQDLYILKKIQELRNRQYSRSEIKQIFKERGITSDKIVNRDVNLPHFKQAKEEPSVPALITPEVIQSLSQELEGYIEKGIMNITEKFLVDLKSFTDSLQEKIDNQNQVISSQKKEIDNLKSTIGNINRTTINTAKAIEKIPESFTEAAANSLNEIKEDINKISAFDSKNTTMDVETLKKELIEDNSKATKTIMDNVNKASIQINEMSANIDKLSQNRANENQVRANLRKDINSGLNKLYEEIEKSLKSTSIEQLSQVGKMLKDNAAPPLDMPVENINELHEEVESLKEKYKTAEKTIEALAQKNGELANRNNITGQLLNKKDQEINDLKNKLSIVMAATIEAKKKAESQQVNNADDTDEAKHNVHEEPKKKKTGFFSFGK